jgi:hypothetical protein
MLGLPLRYWLKHPTIAVTDLASDPIEIWTTVHDSYVAERKRRERESDTKRIWRGNGGSTISRGVSGRVSWARSFGTCCQNEEAFRDRGTT